jgi:hypothetical protein
MINPWLFVAGGLLALLLIFYLFVTGHRRSNANLDALSVQLLSVNVDAFRNLIDEGEEQYLREHLSRQEFRGVHRERMLAAIEYVWGAARNARILIRLAEAARRELDPSVAIAAENLLNSALRLRLYSLQVLPRLYLSSLLPFVKLASESIADRYDAATRQIVTLRCLQSSTRSLSSAI